MYSDFCTCVRKVVLHALLGYNNGLEETIRLSKVVSPPPTSLLRSSAHLA